MTSPSTEGRVRKVAEAFVAGRIPLWLQPEWIYRFPWLLQGSTGRGTGDDPANFGLFGETPVGDVLARWRELRSTLGMAAAVHSRQVHGSLIHEASALPAGMVIVDGFDSHLTSFPGVLLTVSVADCVPVFLVAEPARVIALVHAGWRGVADDVLEKTLERLLETSACSPADVWLHCGPSICGRCYEVGPEVHAALYPQKKAPSRPAPVDLAAALADRALTRGLTPENITTSAHCTRCGPGDFFSHRGGSSARQLGLLGVRP